jgi:homoserine O-succinyltransferase
MALLEAASGDQVIEVRCSTLDGIPRGERTARRIAEDYAPLASITRDPPDLLIVTGSDPLAIDIEDEPYWGDLSDLLVWGREHVSSLLLSCLAAHAGLVVFDGVERGRLAAKCTGVFPQQADVTHPLAAGLGSPVVLPHSRLNDVPVDAVRRAGYRVALQSEATGWSVVSKESSALVVLVQGHPEYDPSSLLREYRRDLNRYLIHERDVLPCLPLHCVAPEDWDHLVQLQQRVVDGERDSSLVESFPFEEAGVRATWPWRPVAAKLYANWLAGVPQRSN